MSVLMLNRGLLPFMNSLDDIVDINDSVKRKAQQGVQIVDLIQDLYANLTVLEPRLEIEGICPQSAEQSSHNQSLVESLELTTAISRIDEGISAVDQFIATYVGDIDSGLMHLADVATSINTGVNRIYQNDWIVKFFLIVLNVVNGFLIFGVLLSKYTIVYMPYQALLAYCLVPLFLILVLGSIAATSVSMIMTMLNAGK
jgi:hypothetical protein